MSHGGTTWQRAEVARVFVEERRAAIPYGPDQVRMMLQVIQHFCPEPRRLLDLGCGDGFVARAVLERCPAASALLLDHSEPMLEQARTAMAPFAGRYELRLADLGEPLGLAVASGSMDLVVSGYAIHHLPHAQKRQLYEQIYAALAPGGLFVNIEHVASPTREIEALFDALYIDHMSAHHQHPPEQTAAKYHGRPDKADNILAPLEMQIEWLREIGFAHVDCYFKWLELAVFGGVRA